MALQTALRMVLPMVKPLMRRMVLSKSLVLRLQ